MPLCRLREGRTREKYKCTDKCPEVYDEGTASNLLIFGGSRENENVATNQFEHGVFSEI